MPDAENSNDGPRNDRSITIQALCLAIAAAQSASERIGSAFEVREMEDLLLRISDDLERNLYTPLAFELVGSIKND